MSAFSEVSSRVRLPGRTLVLEPWMFADDWERKPTEAFCVGLRLMSEQDKTKARGEAERLALDAHPHGGPNALDCFNDALLRQVVALGICDPNDVASPCSLLPMAEDQVREALTTRGARFIYDAIHRYEVEVSPLVQEATDDDLLELCDIIQSGEIESARSAPLARRFLRYALEELRGE